MARNYAEELDTWVSQREVTGREKNLVAFHAVRDDIQTALAAGFEAKTTWAHMEEQGCVNFGYEPFMDPLHRVIKTGRSARPQHPSG